MNWMNYISLMRFEVLSLGVIVLLLLIKIFSENISAKTVCRIANISLVIILITNIYAAIQNMLLKDSALDMNMHLNLPESIFGGMFVMNPTFALEKSILTFATLLISLQANVWLKKQQNYLEFYLLLFSILTGMYYLVSSGNFLMFYLGLEMATIPLTALASFDFGRMRSAEGAGKMILSSAFSSAILLFGLSLIYGATGSLDFSAVSEAFQSSPLEIFALGFILVGFAFKTSAVPFHLWTADVYEGSPVAVTTFLSVVSKGASIFTLMTVLYKVFGNSHEKWIHILVLLSAITMTVGNFFAIRQSNIKRFLAFSSITQAGYILIGVASSTAVGMASVIYFLIIYVFSNVGAFTAVSVISEQTGKEDIDDYKGLYKTNPLFSIVILIFMFSLAGIPPTAGFFGKLFLLTSGASAGLITLIIIASLNMIISLYYYLRIVKAMFVDKNENPIENFSSDGYSKIVFVISVVSILSIGFLNFIFEYIHSLSFGL